MSQTVFVSGATGFIAQHIVKQLIEHGHAVIGTVRSSSKGDLLAKQLNSSKFSYEIVEDVAKEGAFDKPLQKHPEVTTFLHTASPFHFKATDIENELLKPAVNGTVNALKAIATHGPQIKNVVITSSVAAVATASKENDPNHVNNEESWNEVTREEAISNPRDGYRGSKTFAERAAWDFIKENKVNFILNVVNPTFVFGPQAFAVDGSKELNTSSEVINSYLKLDGPNAEIPSYLGGFIDVRDVARAHLVAFEKPNVKNQRLILNSGRFASQDILDILNNHFTELKGKIPVGTPGSGESVTKNLAKLDNTKTKEILGFEFIGLKQTVIDSVQQILDATNSA